VAVKQPGVNPIDGKIWAVIQQHAYKPRVSNVDEFKWQLTEVWTGLLLQNTVDTAAGERRKQLRHFNVDM